MPTRARGCEEQAREQLPESAAENLTVDVGVRHGDGADVGHLAPHVGRHLRDVLDHRRDVGVDVERVVRIGVPRMELGDEGPVGVGLDVVAAISRRARRRRSTTYGHGESTSTERGVLWLTTPREEPQERERGAWAFGFI